MKILFIYSLQDIRPSSKPLRSPDQMQFGISYISSFLKNHGHQTKLVVLSRKWGRNRAIDECLKKFHPDLICFTAVYSEYNFVVTVAKYIRKHYPGIYLLIGGCHVSLNADKIPLDDFDALCVGEGEYPTLELVSALEKESTPSGISNLRIKNNSGIEMNPTRPFLQDIDSLPFPDREMWREWIEEEPGAREAVLLGRGCPFECTYCCNYTLKELASGCYVRFRSPENIVEEIKEIVTRFPQKKDVYLETESFGINKDWSLKLCNELERLNGTLSEPLRFGANLRITSGADLEDLFAACKRGNFKYFNIGLESGSERVRSEILKRNYSNQDVIGAVSLARKHGLKVTFFNMMGIPGETLLDFKETINVNRICQPDSHYNSIFFPYPGTELYALCEEKGFLNKNFDAELERRKAVLDLPGFSRRQIERSYVWFDYYVYKGHRPTYKILMGVLTAKLNTSYYLKYYYEWLGNLPLLRVVKRIIRSMIEKLFQRD